MTKTEERQLKSLARKREQVAKWLATVDDPEHISRRNAEIALDSFDDDELLE